MPSAEYGAEDAGLLSPVRAGSAVEAATGDRAFLQALLDAEAALTRAQAAAGQAPASAAHAVTVAARAELYDVRDLALRARSGGNPVIPLVADLTAAVARTDPGAAAYVHRGATSQDIMDTAAMLVAARALPLIAADLDRAAGALARLAAAHRDTAMPGRTLTQHAVPTTFGLKAAGWRSLVLDARERLASVAPPVQLGGAAGTLAAFAAHAEEAAPAPSPAPGPAQDASGPTQVENRPGADIPHDGPAAGGADPGLRLLAAYAAETGLAEPGLPWHTLRSPVADLGSALAFTTGALGKIAADVLVLARTEIGEVAEGSGGGSSAMPHKSNPVRATLTAAAARQSPSLAAVLFGSLAAEDERPAGAWHAEWQALRELLRLAGGAARETAELTEGLRVFPGRMREHLDLTGGLVVSERIAVALGPVVGRARAKELLTAASRRAAAEGIPLADALAGEPDLAGLLPRERLRELTDPARYTGSAAALVDRALASRAPRGCSAPGQSRPHGSTAAPAATDPAQEEPGKGRTGADAAPDPGSPRRRAERRPAPPSPITAPPRRTTMADLPHHRLDGPADGPPLILGPSLGTSLAVWEPQVPRLAHTHRVLRWDLPGHGGSPAGLIPTDGSATVADLAALVLRLADAQGWDRFAYAGVSIGGAVGLHLAAYAPERVASLALVCSSARFGEPSAWRERAALVRAKGTEAMVASRTGTWFGPEVAESPRGRALLEDLRSADPAGYAACCDALASFDLRAELPSIGVSTLVVAGREDPATPPAHAREITDAVPGASLVEVAGAAHLANVERPGPVTAALLAHFAEPGAGDDAVRRAAGMAVRRAVLGDAHVDRAIANTTAFTARFQDFITRYAWGEIWTSDRLDRRTRSFITLTALVARGHEAELAMHVRAALRNGLTAEEIGETLLQTAVYCGVPAANAAFAVAQRVLDEVGKTG